MFLCTWQLRSLPSVIQTTGRVKSLLYNINNNTPASALFQKQYSTSNNKSWLRIINVTDVYKLDNFPSLKTLVDEKRAEVEKDGNGKLVTILTGDFIAPYLLSSIDKGVGMVNMLNNVPVDIVIFGNHEDDMQHNHVMDRIRQYQGTWVNSNLLDHEGMSMMKQSHSITINNKSNNNERKIGFIGVLSDEKSLYKQNAFNGAINTIKDPYDTIAELKKQLEEEENHDLVIPLCHLYEPQDAVTCERFDLPLVLSGHDHHTVNRVQNDTLLVKAGENADFAAMIDIVWNDSNVKKPKVSAELLKVSNWKANVELQTKVDNAYSLLKHLENTEVAKIPQKFKPFSSFGARNQLCTTATFLWTAFRDSLCINDTSKDDATVDCVIISGGNVRGGTDYADDAIFSLEDLMSEVQDELEAIVVPMSGKLIEDGIIASHSCGPNPGFMQFDDGITLDSNGKKVVTIAGEPIDYNKTYKVATTLWDIQESSAAPWATHFEQNDSLIARTDWAVRSQILDYWATHTWKQLFSSLDINNDGTIDANEFAQVDVDGDNKISRENLANALNKKLGFKVDLEENGFVDLIMQVAGDSNSDHLLDLNELKSKK